MGSCTAGDISCWIVSQANVLNNLANSLPSVIRLLSGFMYLLGVIFAIRAIISLRAFAESRTMMSSQSSIKEPLLYFLIASVFIYAPSSLHAFTATAFGYSNPLQYASISSTNGTLSTLFGSNSLVGPSLALILQVMGLIAFIRGWILISHGSQQQGPGQGTGKGIVHIVGGILAINIVGTIQIINNTLYG